MNMPVTETLKKRFLDICASNGYQDAILFQKEIRELIPGRPYQGEIKTVCGLDISYNKFSSKIYAAAAVFSFPELKAIEETIFESETTFAYIPGLFAYREGPAVLSVVEKLQSGIDLFILDGQGMAHPRGAGFASMLGLLLDKPTIGCAKTRLVGTYIEPGFSKGSTSDLIYEDRIVGKVLRSRSNVKPIYISVGYKINLERAVDLILKMCTQTRIPDPIKLAHLLANLARRKSI